MASKPTDAELLVDARNGDERALRALYDRYAGRLRVQIRRQIPRRLRRRLAVSDVLQETFATAFEKLDTFEGPHDDSFRRWLARIAELKVQRHARDQLDTLKRAAGRELSQGLRPDTGQIAKPQASPSDHAIAAETAERLERALGDLREDYARILRLVHDDGMSVAAAGEHMGRSREAARKLYGRAISRLAEKLEQNDE